jgi:hypothetical protein
MGKQPDFDLQAAHKYFSAECFNRAWDFIEKPLIKPGEEEKMLLLSLASLWHWTQRDDCTPTNLSIGYWQVARVYALLRQADQARRYASLCLEASQSEGVLPFYRGYAYEALARAEQVADNLDLMEKYLIQAHQVATGLTEPDEKKQLLKDLATIR